MMHPAAWLECREAQGTVARRHGLCLSELGACCAKPWHILPPVSAVLDALLMLGPCPASRQSHVTLRKAPYLYQLPLLS